MTFGAGVATYGTRILAVSPAYASTSRGSMDILMRGAHGFLKIINDLLMVYPLYKRENLL